jgi:hypothetical protein
VLRRVLTMRRNGHSQRSICAALNTDKILTPGGAPRWWPSHVCRLLATAGANDMQAELWPS